MTEMPMVHLDLHDGESGGFDLRIEVGGAICAIGSCGDVSDTVGGFARAGLMIASGGWHASWSFEDEPAETRVVLDRYFDPKKWRIFLKIRVLGFPDFFDHLPDRDGSPLFEADCDPDDFAREVLRNMEQLLNELGPERRWKGTNAFPLRALEALRSAMKTTDLPRYEEDHPTGGYTIFGPPKAG